MWINPTRPWPSGKYVRNEDSGGSTTLVDVFLEGRLFPNDGFINDALILPGDKDRNATEGAKDEQADEWSERKQVQGIHTERFIRLHAGLLSVTILLQEISLSSKKYRSK